MRRQIPLQPLMLLQARMLRENRAACVVLLLLISAAMLARRGAERPAQGRTYIVYWEDSPWVRSLQSALQDHNQDPPLEIAAVESLTDSRGVIHYPQGTHSIQLRPPAAGDQSWLIWYWYSGSDATAMAPAISWFWNVTAQHFQMRPPITVQVSPLHVRLPWLSSLKLSIHTALREAFWQATLVWTAIFFCACHLPTMALVQQRENRTLESLLVSPAGWAGVVWATALSYLALASGAAMLLILLLPLQVPVEVAIPHIVLVAGAHLSLAFAIAMACRSTASASCCLLGYLLAVSLITGVCNRLPGVPVTACCVDSAFIMSVSADASDAALRRLLGLLSLGAWTFFWFQLARFSVFQVRRV